MKIGDIIDALTEFDPEEEAAFHLLTHNQLHVAAEAAGIKTDCEQVDTALDIYQTMLDNHIGSDPYRMFRALGRAAESETLQDHPAEHPIVH